jgi:hypothetical protein
MHRTNHSAAVSIIESSTAASAPTALCDDAQACKLMRQRATQHESGESKCKGKSTIENAAKRLLTASFDKLLPAPHSRPP